MRRLLSLLSLLFLTLSATAQRHIVRHDVPRDSIILSDPCVLADSATATYYMTGTGGKLWKSKNLSTWDGPYTVAKPDPKSWTGPHPAIWAAEIHPYKGKYYYFGTFTNDSIIICKNHNGDIPRRATHILVSDNPDGPFVPVGDADYLPADVPTLDGTLWVEEDSTPYMVFCGEWLLNDNGTMEAVALKKDLSAPDGKPFLLFKASNSPWSRKKSTARLYRIALPMVRGCSEPQQGDSA